MTPDYNPLFKRWKPDVSDAPKDGTFFMGRITGTNRARAVRWTTDYFDDPGFYDNSGMKLNICQWITFTDFADIRSCVWRQK